MLGKRRRVFMIVVAVAVVVVVVVMPYVSRLWTIFGGWLVRLMGWRMCSECCVKYSII